MDLDSDIAGADELGLRRIREQTYREEVAKTAGAVESVRGEAALLLTKEQETRLEIVRAIAANYMKPTTGTAAATIEQDTANDTARLRAAVNAVFDVVMNG